MDSLSKEQIQQIKNDAAREAEITASVYDGNLRYLCVPNPAGGWTDSLINAFGSSEIRDKYLLNTDEQWSEFLDLWEDTCNQRVRELIRVSKMTNQDIKDRIRQIAGDSCCIPHTDSGCGSSGPDFLTSAEDIWGKYPSIYEMKN